jgi:hypothetical protein
MQSSCKGVTTGRHHNQSPYNRTLSGHILLVVHQGIAVVLTPVGQLTIRPLPVQKQKGVSGALCGRVDNLLHLTEKVKSG